VAARRRLAASLDDARTGTASAVGSLVALVVISVASFPLEMPATIALAGIALGFIAGESQPPVAAPVAELPIGDTVGRWPWAIRLGALAGALLLLPWTAVRAERNIRASGWLGVAERALRRDRGVAGAAGALTALALSLDATPIDYRAELRVSQMLLREKRPVESRLAAKQALAIEPYAPNAWAALAAADVVADDAPAARRDADEALRLLEDDPFALHLRAQASAREGDSAAAEADMSRLRALAEHSDDVETTRAARALLDGAE
jgi:tetratricopeptide (TPR) repeat protein